MPSTFAFKGFSEHAISFGGRTFRRDDVEEKLSEKNDKAAFYETPEYKEKFMNALSRNAYKEMHGTLEMPEAPRLDAVAEKTMAALPVNAEQVQASTNVLTETMRRTEFKE